MGEMVIVAYKPKPGCEAALEQSVRTHVPRLRDWGFATARPALAMRAADGTIVEVFEWHAGAVQKAHSDPRVAEMWAEFGAVCDYLPLAQLPESANLFAHYVPIDL